MNKKIFITALMSSLLVFSSCSRREKMNNPNSDTQNTNETNTDVQNSSVSVSLFEPDEEGYIYKYKYNFKVDFDDENLKKELVNHLNLLPEYEKERKNSIKKQGYYKLKGQEIDVSFLSDKSVSFTFTKNDVIQADSNLIAINLPISDTLKYPICFMLYIDLLSHFLKDNITYSIAVYLGYFSEFDISDSLCLCWHPSLYELKEVR